MTLKISARGMPEVIAGEAQSPLCAGDFKRTLRIILALALGALASLLMAWTREGVLPSYVPVSVTLVSVLAACWGSGVKEATLRVLTFSVGALVAEAVVNSAPAFRVSNRVLANAIILVGVGDALVGLLVMLPIVLVAGALSALLSGGD